LALHWLKEEKLDLLPYMRKQGNKILTNAYSDLFYGAFMQDKPNKTTMKILIIMVKIIFSVALSVLFGLFLTDFAKDFAQATLMEKDYELTDYTLVIAFGVVFVLYLVVAYIMTIAFGKSRNKWLEEVAPEVSKLL
jgi:hypothetical protein